MQRLLVVDIDTDRKDTIIVGPMKRFENEEIQAKPLLDMGCLCEALCLMIRICHNSHLKDQSDSIRDCIDHLKKGFIEENYMSKMSLSEHNPFFKFILEWINKWGDSIPPEAKKEINNWVDKYKN
jgi:hypothetical protein